MTEQLYAGFVLGEILGYGVGPFLSFLEMRRSACASQAFFEHLGSARCGLALVARDLRAGGIVAPPHHDARGDPVAAFRAVARALRRRALVSGGSAVGRALPSLAPAPSLPSSARCFFSLLNCTSRRLQCCWVGPRGVPVDRAHVDVVEALAPRGESSASARAPLVLPTHHRSYGAGVPGHFAHSCLLSHAFVVRREPLEGVVSGGGWDFAFQARCVFDSTERRSVAAHCLRVDDPRGAGAALEVSELHGERFERGLGARPLARLADAVGVARLAFSVGDERPVRANEPFVLFQPFSRGAALRFGDVTMRLMSLRKLARHLEPLPGEQPFRAGRPAS